MAALKYILSMRAALCSLLSMSYNLNAYANTRTKEIGRCLVNTEFRLHFALYFNTVKHYVV